MKRSQILAGSLAVIMAIAMGTGAALAADVTDDAAGKGNVMVRLRGLAVLPSTDSSITPIGGHVDASNSVVPEADFTYFFTPNWAAELIAATTRHHVTAVGTSAGNVNLGQVSLLPPTLTAQYHFLASEKFSPYLGAGLNYTYFFDHKLPAGGIITQIHYQAGFNPAIQAGVDYHVKGNWYLNFDVKHIFLQTDVKLNGGAIKADVNLDPTIVGFGIGYRF